MDRRRTATSLQTLYTICMYGKISKNTEVPVRTVTPWTVLDRAWHGLDRHWMLGSHFVQENHEHTSSAASRRQCRSRLRTDLFPSILQGVLTHVNPSRLRNRKYLHWTWCSPQILSLTHLSQCSRSSSWFSVGSWTA